VSQILDSELNYLTEKLQTSIKLLNPMHHVQYNRVSNSMFCLNAHQLQKLASYNV